MPSSNHSTEPCERSVSTCRLRDECLNVEWFSSLGCRQKLAKFREHYNHRRPHSALADRTPAAFAELHGSREKSFMLMGRALQSLLIESLECAKPAKRGRRGLQLPKISRFVWYRKWERFNCPKSPVSFVTENGSGSRMGCIRGGAPEQMGPPHILSGRQPGGKRCQSDDL